MWAIRGPWRSQGVPGASLGGFRDVPRGLRDVPRGPRGVPGGPRGVPEGPRGVPRGSPGAPARDVPGIPRILFINMIP